MANILLSAYHTLATSCINSLNSHNNPIRYYFNLYFTNLETEAQKVVLLVLTT